ncbi:MAG: hypothetical protein IT378_05635 [Sandaracinaceae bacterium]|nr:hypothetical protein [Sandaracinaceae bacterium]
MTLMVALTACGGTAGTDAGTDSGNGGTDGGGGGTDGGGGDTDGGGPEPLPTLRAWDGSNMVAADLSCLGMLTAPAAGADTTYPVRIVARGVADEIAPNRIFRIYTDNVVPTDDSCGANCIELTADGTGMQSVMLPADAWIAYQVIENAGAPGATLTTLQINKATAMSDFNGSGTDPGEALELSAITGAIFSSALGAANIMRQEGTVIFTGTTRDCAGNELIGAEARVFGAGGQIMSGRDRTGPRIVYWNDDGPAGLLPSPSRTFTSNQGRYAGANLPSGGTLRVEIWAVTTDGAQPSRIGCEEIAAIDNSVYVLDVGPTRMDGPTACR